VQKLRQKISAAAPFAMVKLSHHGSNNAFSEDILSELGGTVLFGICAGVHSEHHPNRATLKILDNHTDTIKWARTDRNGQVTMTFTGNVPTIKIARGELNDERPNSQDIGVVEPEILPETSAPEVAPIALPSAGTSSDVVEVVARIPHVDTRVVITVEVSPSADGARPRAYQQEGLRQPDAWRLAGGRQLDRLLFVTNEARLARNIGRQEATAVLAAIRAAGMPLCNLGNDTTDAATAAAAVRPRLRDERADGVVILGGHDVVPLQSIDCLPAALRTRLDDSDDPDGFVVWSDDIYGDFDGDGLPEIPVSRIPDGKSADLVFSALRAGAPRSRERAGIRNIARPFADGIFRGMAGAQSLLVSAPTVFDEHPPFKLDADQLYFMRHGDYADGTRFWGEETAGDREAANIGNLPASINGVVFTGCCWGALTTDTPAGLHTNGRAVGIKTPEASIALSTLARGALAFIGCTGAHYSPTESPYNYFGGPMHKAFWRRYNAGTPPAKALFEAKVDYIAGMPHGRESSVQRAIEFKILRQYTCLGLGW
jgi:hypothetical protein